LGNANKKKNTIHTYIASINLSKFDQAKGLKDIAEKQSGK
jgi:hypothetical protein